MNRGKPLKELVGYFLLCYALSWALWSPYFMSPLLGHDLTSEPLFHLFGSLGPLIASFILTYRSKGLPGVRNLLVSMSQWRVGPYYIVLAFLGPFFILGISMMVSNFINGSEWSLSGLGLSKEFEHLPLALFVLINILVFGYGEETGWRGFALPRFQQRFNAFVSSVLLALCWAVWHWPLFFYKLSGYYSMNITGALGWIFSLLVGSIIMTFLFNSTKGSILVCAVFHGTMDIAFISDFTDKNLMNYNGMLITVVGILVLVFTKPSRLSRAPRVTTVNDEVASKWAG